MILAKITLTIEDREFDIRHFNYRFCRDTDSKGRPSSRYYGGMFFIEMESLPENYLLSRLLIFEQMQVSGKIEIWANDGEQCIRRIEFEKAYICHHIEEMDTNQALPMLTTISISPLRLDINKKVRIDRRWPETQGFWTKYVPPKEEKQQQEKEVIYVKKVEGESQAGVGDKVKYRVTQYTQEGITEDEKKDIKWVVSVEGKRTNLSDKGEVIILTIKPEWAGKEIIVMPYLHSSTESVSVKTEVQDTKHYKVIKETGFVEKDFSITPQMSRYKIHGVNSSELTIKRLQRKVAFDDVVVAVGINKIVMDYNTKYKNNFPDDYYDEFGRYIASFGIHKYLGDKISGLMYVCKLIDSAEDFNHGFGAPLFHIYENVVRKNNDTGLDKVLHFLYSATATYLTTPATAKAAGILKEFGKDEFYSWFNEKDKGWDDKDMDANNRGIKFGEELKQQKL